MARHQIRTPNGLTLWVEAPEDATEAELYQFAEAMMLDRGIDAYAPANDEIRERVKDPRTFAPEDSDLGQIRDAGGRVAGGLLKFGGSLLDATAPDRAAPTVFPMSDEDYEKVGTLSNGAGLSNAKNFVNRGYEMAAGAAAGLGRLTNAAAEHAPLAPGALKYAGSLMQLPEMANQQEMLALETDRAERGLPSLHEQDRSVGMGSGINRAADAVQDYGNEVVDYWTGDQTRANQQALGRAWDEEQGGGIGKGLGFVANPRNWATVADAVGPSLVEFAVPGGIVGRGVKASGLQRATQLADEAAEAAAAAGGDALAIARARTQGLTQAAKDAQQQAGLTAAATQAGQSASQQANDAVNEVMAMGPEQLAELPGWAETVEAMGFERAREVAAKMVGESTLSSSGLINLVTYTGGQKLGLMPFDTKIAGGATVAGRAGAMTGASGRLARGGVHGVQEASGEFLQGAGEQIGQNVGMGAIDSRQDPLEGALSAGALEASVGFGVGVPTGLMSAPTTKPIITPDTPAARAAPAPDPNTPGGRGASKADEILAEAGLNRPLNPNPGPSVVPDTAPAPAGDAGDTTLDDLLAPYAPTVDDAEGVLQERARDVSPDDRAQREPFDSAFGAGLQVPEEGADKAWLKTHVDSLPLPTPAQLPTDTPWHYFRPAQADAVVQIDALVPTKQEGVRDSSLNRMAAAAAGKIDKRDAIDVRENGDGTYTVIDGNGTYAVAKQLGLTEVPVRLVDAAPGKEGWRRGRGMVDAEVGERMVKLYERAADAKPGFDSRVQSIARQVGGEPMTTGLKGRTRAEEKVADALAQGMDPDAAVADLKDVLRATILVDDPEAARAAMAKAIEVMPVARLKDNLSPGTPDRGGMGYRDANIVYALPNGAVAELQIMTRAMFEAKEGEGHRIYAEIRSLAEKEQRGEAMTADELAILEDGTARSLALYQAAWPDQGLDARLDAGLDADPATAAAASSRDTEAQGEPGLRTSGTTASLNTPPGGSESTDVVTNMPSGVSRTQRASTLPSSSKNLASSGIDAPSNTSGSAIASSSAGGGSPSAASVAPVVPADTGGADVAAAVEAALDRAGAGSQRPDVQVVETIDALPDGLRSQLDGDTDGLYDPATGTIYIVRSALPADPALAADRALWVLWHELAGHKGLRAAFPGPALAKILAEADRNPKVKALADAIQAERALTPGQEIGREEAVEEALAELAAALRTNNMAELEAAWGVPGLDSTAGLISRIVRAIKAHIVKAFGGRMPYSDGQVRELLGNAWSAVRDAPAQTDGQVRQSRAPKTGARHASEVNTRTPASKRAPEVAAPGEVLVVGLEAARKSGKAFDKNAELVAGYVNMKPGPEGESSEAIVERFIDEVTANLLYLHDQMPAKVRARAKLWYDGGQKIADRFAEQYGVTAESVAGVMAALSPQKDWYMNVSLGERVIDIVTKRAAEPWSDAMTETADRIFPAERYAKLRAEFEGKTLAEIEPLDAAAAWVRTYDQTYHNATYPILTPEGDTGANVTTASGADGRLGWGSLGEIGKAVGMLRDPSLENISGQLGQQHKIRNFYNNIISPYSERGHVTIDTHAVAAALLRPLSGASTEVVHNFGGVGAAGSTVQGLSGTYALHAEALRRAAKERDLLPREMQSITWEAVRALFSPAFKRGKKNVAAADTLWDNYRNGKSTREEVQREITELAGGIQSPTWAGSGTGGDAAPWRGTFTRAVAGAVVPGGRAGADSGAAGRDPDGAVRQSRRRDGERGQDARGAQGGPVAAPERAAGEALPGTPRVRGATGPDPRLVRVAEQYARARGIDFARQDAYVEIDPARAARIADAYEAMPHAPQDPRVRAAYADLIEQTRAQYDALAEAGYGFWFIDIASEAGQDYASTPWNAMRDIRANQTMGVFPTAEGFGSDTGFDPEANPLLADTGLRWPVGGPDGELQPVYANDLFRAVHDAFGHGLEGAGFRARGEENAWQAHARMFTGDAVGAITSETRGQNSALNYGKYGPHNRTAKVEDTIFADQKTGLMPEWTWKEGRAGDLYREGGGERVSEGGPVVAGRDEAQDGRASRGESARAGVPGAVPGERAGAGAGAAPDARGEPGARGVVSTDARAAGAVGDGRAGGEQAAARATADDTPAGGRMAEGGAGERASGSARADADGAGGRVSREDVAPGGRRSGGGESGRGLDDAVASPFAAPTDRDPMPVEEAAELLPARGEPIATMADAARRYRSGDRLFAMDEEGAPVEISSAADLSLYAPDQLQALPHYGEEPDAEPEPDAPKPGTPAPLYVSRPVEDDGGLRQWAIDAGLEGVLPAGEMHVTVAYSKAPVDVAKAPPQRTTVAARAAGAPVQLRSALAMPVRATALVSGHRRYRAAGASHDYGDTYTPHITLKYDATPADLALLEAAPPFRGRVTLGGETQAGLRPSDAPRQSRRTVAHAAIDRTKKVAGLRRDGYPVTSFKQSGSTWSKSIKDAKGEALTKIRRVLQDRLIDVRDAQEDIEAAIGQPIDDLANLYQAENLMHGKAADGVRRVRDKLIDPLKKAVAESGLSAKEIERFLWAQHALERNARIARVNPGMPDGGSGMTNADARAVLEAAGDNPALTKISDQVQAIRIDTLNTLRNSGQITPDQYRALRGMYQFYVPLRGHSGEVGEQRQGGGKGIDMRGKPVQRALGRNTEPANILGELVGDAERAQVQASKAEVGRTLLRAALQHPNPDFWMVEPVTVQPRYSEATGEVYMAVTSEVNDEEAVIVKHQGESYIVRLVDPQLRAAMKNLGVEGFEGVSKYLGWVNRWLSAVFTRYNPAFIPVNMIRDMIQGAIGVSSELGAKALGEVTRIYPGAAAGLYAESRGQGDASVPDAQKTMADWAREFYEVGAATGYQVFADPARLQHQIEMEMAGLADLVRSGRPIAAVGEAARRSKLFQAVEAGNEIIENSMRLSVYVQRRRAGVSRGQAATYAKDLTVNFNRKGSGTAIGNALFVFFNAGVQGAHRALRLLRDPKVLAGMGGLAGMQFAFAMTMGAARYEDEDETLWEKIPDHVKSRAFVIPTGYSEDGGARYVAIPMPYGFNMFTYLGGYPANLSSKTWRSRNDPVKKTMGDVGRSVIDSFSVIPIGDTGWYFPTTMRIFANLNANTDDLGRRIRDEGAFEKFEGPRASKGRADTPEIYKDFARALNRLGGGDDYTKPVSPLLDFAPEDIEYLLAYFGGGPATMVQQLWRGGERAGADLPVDFNDIPVARRVVGSQRKAQLDSTAFYDTREVYERGMARLRDAYAQQGEAEFYAQRAKLGVMFEGIELDRYKTTAKDGRYSVGDVRVGTSGMPTLTPTDGSVFDVYRATSKEVTGYNRAIRNLYSDPSLDRLQRRREIERLQNERAQAMRQFVNAWNDRL